MKKGLLMFLLLVILCMPQAFAEEGLIFSKDCSCPAGTGTVDNSYYEWDAISANGHVLRLIEERYCARCHECLAKWNMVLTDLEPHTYDGYECTVCGYWRLGTATAYDSTPYAALRNASVGSIVTFGSYEQDGVYNNGSEPIEWLVLDRRGSQVLLLSRYGLDVYPYHHTSTAINWSNSAVRQWLQSEFYSTAFSSQEQGMIVTTHNSTPVNSSNSGSPGPDAYDTVFLLSSTEATQYLTSQESRMVKATSYALMRGAGTNYSQNSFWWLRSYADASRRKVLMINSQGNVYASYMNDYEAVVRPAVWVEVE